MSNLLNLNRTECVGYGDRAQEMLDGLVHGALPHVGDLVYMHGASGAGHTAALLVMNRIAEDPQLAVRFDAAVDAYFAKPVQ